MHIRYWPGVGGHGLRNRGVLHGDLLVVAEHRGEFLLRPLGWVDGQWVLEPVRPGEVAIPVEIDNLDESPLFGVAVHAVHHLGPRETRR